VDADIASAEAHLLAGQPERALALIEGALAEAAAIHAATLLPSGHRVQAAALLALGEIVRAQASVAQGLRQSSSPDVAHERGFLLTIAAHIAALRQDPGAAQVEQEASTVLRSLGVVRVPLPDFAG
jgi:ATP/maltotriose-dependent transcriptional regulator MalT